MKKIIYLDMDGVIVDLGAEIDRWFKEHPHLVEKYKSCPDHITGIFRFPEPIEKAVESVRRLSESGKYELFILTSSPWGNPEALTDKRYWVERYFGELFHKKMITTHRKDLLIGDYLIDDRLANGASEFTGELLQFGWNYETESWNEYSWSDILKKLL